MREVAVVVSLLATAACASTSIDKAPMDPRPRKDEITQVDNAAFDQVERDIAALTAEARAELPALHRRFVKGLPDGSVLYFTVRIPIAGARLEQVFVRVVSWRDGQVDGTVSSEPGVPGAIKVGDRLRFEDEMVLDWTIVQADGTEQGNRLGHYLELRQ